jgi:hypothetical protein
LRKKNQGLEKLISKEGEKAPRRWYPIFIVLLCIRLIIEAAISFRAAPKALHIAFSEFVAVKNKPIPSHKTIGRWLTQVGLYKLNRPKAEGKDWAVIIDNSIQLGTKKCLVILGIRLSQLPRGRALSFEDMEVLLVELHENLDSQALCNKLEQVQEKLGKIEMVCADDGPDLRGGIACFCAKSGAGRVLDVIHKLATFLRRRYEGDIKWQAFSTAAASARKSMQQTQAAHLAPPNQRTKCRFLNIEPLVKWGVDVMRALNTKDHGDKQLLESYCGWVRQYQDLIEQLDQYDLISRIARQHVREEGFCALSGEKIEEILDVALSSRSFNYEACEYAGEVIDFFTDQVQGIAKGRIWVGSSEVIESLFGKMKNLEGDQSKGGFTALVLGIVACVGKTDANIVREAMKQVKTSDVALWEKEHVGKSLLAKRKAAFKGRQRKKERNARRQIYKKTVQESTGIYEEKAAGF